MEWHKIKEEKQDASFELWWKELAWELEDLCYNLDPAANLLCAKGFSNSNILHTCSSV